jgi:hypothetical protein
MLGVHQVSYLWQEQVISFKGGYPPLSAALSKKHGTGDKTPA